MTWDRSGLPDGFRFYDLRHTGHTLSTRSGATLKDTMVRAEGNLDRGVLILLGPGEQTAPLGDFLAGTLLARLERRHPCSPARAPPDLGNAGTPTAELLAKDCGPCCSCHGALLRPR